MRTHIDNGQKADDATEDEQTDDRVQRIGTLLANEAGSGKQTREAAQIVFAILPDEVLRG